jgi:large subunit ribosomal protein L29
VKPQEIRALSTDALQARLNDAKEELMKLRFRQATGELTDTSHMRTTRREVARLATILNERLQADNVEGAK